MKNTKSPVTIDFNNMFSERIGSHGITDAEFQSAARKIPAVHSAMQQKKESMAWRALPYSQDAVIREIKELAAKIDAKYENFVVLGIGGSALGQRALFGALKHPKYNELPREKRGGLRFYVEDNIDPDRLNALFDVIDAEKTVFNVITKSGNTVETMSQFILVLDLLTKKLGNGYKDNIIVTTDLKKGDLRKIADENGIRTFVVPDGVGGRFSVLSPVGLIAAAVLHIDIDALLKGAADMDAACTKEDAYGNPAYLYAVLYCLAMKKGVNISVLMPYADGLQNAAEWYAQLWAESLGKHYNLKGEAVHEGQTPVRTLGVTDQHSQIQLYTEGPFDKIISFIEVKNFRTELKIPSVSLDLHGAAYMQGHSFNELIAAECRATEYAVKKAGKMSMKISLEQLDAYAMGALFFFFEMATAAAGEILEINAFDQPGVEEGKIATFALMGRSGYEEKAAELSREEAKNERFVFAL
jgi:glucose-6-phosphate isomerase